MIIESKTIETSEIIDSRDIIERIETLQNSALDEADKKELKALLKLQKDCTEYRNDWEHGEQLIREDYFPEFICDLILECYNMPKEMEGGKWPYRHLTLDYKAAAEEAKQGYAEVSFLGETYLVRNS